MTDKDWRPYRTAKHDIDDMLAGLSDADRASTVVDEHLVAKALDLVGDFDQRVESTAEFLVQLFPVIRAMQIIEAAKGDK